MWVVSGLGAWLILGLPFWTGFLLGAVLTPTDALVLDDEVVVLTSELGQRRPREGEQIRIVGPVRPFDPDQLRLDGKTLPDDELFGALANRPAIVAQSIDIGG